jgi:hypothetical protein
MQPNSTRLKLANRHGWGLDLNGTEQGAGGTDRLLLNSHVAGDEYRDTGSVCCSDKGSITAHLGPLLSPCPRLVTQSWALDQ